MERHEIKVGDTIKILEMKGEPDYTGRVGVVRSFDSAGQVHGTWGGLAIIPSVDKFEIVENKKGENNEERTRK